MSILRTYNIKHPDSATNNISLSSDGSVSIEGYVSKTSVSGSIMAFVGERSSAPTAGNYFAFGNGATDQSPVLPYNCKLISMALSGAPSNTTNTVVEPIKNGTLQGEGYQLSVASSGVDWQEFANPISYSAGDTFNAQIVTADATDGATVTMVFRVD